MQAKLEKIQKLHCDASKGTLRVLHDEAEDRGSIRRVFSVSNVPEGAVRGRHGHIFGDETLVCVAGACSVRLQPGRDDATTQTFRLESPDEFLHVRPGNWIEMFDFSQDCVLLVTCNQTYKGDPTIANKDDFFDTVERLERVTKR